MTGYDIAFRCSFQFSKNNGFLFRYQLIIFVWFQIGLKLKEFRAELLKIFKKKNAVAMSMFDQIIESKIESTRNVYSYGLSAQVIANINSIEIAEAIRILKKLGMM